MSRLQKKKEVTGITARYHGRSILQDITEEERQHRNEQTTRYYKREKKDNTGMSRWQVITEEERQHRN